jgi:exopolysaccharide production protein ExoQ
MNWNSTAAAVPVWDAEYAACPAEEQPLWTQVSAWLAVLPCLFIAVSGRISTESGPVAFRFTAMEEDSLARRVTRLGCSLLCMIFVARHYRTILEVCRRTKLILLLPAIAIMSALWSQNPSHTLVDAANLWVTTLFAVYLFVRYEGERLMQFLMLTALVALLLSMGAVVAFPSLGIDSYQQGAWRGIFGQRNNAAAVCVLFLVLAFQKVGRSLFDKAARGLVIVLSVLFIVMSGSRTGWLISALAIALSLGLRLLVKMRSLDRVLLLMLLTIPTVILGWFVATNFTSLLAAMDKDPTLTQRTVIWAEVIPSILKRPLLGYGYSSFWQGLNGESQHAVLTTGWMEGQAQDGYLDILLQVGLVGLIPLICVFARAFLRAARAIEQRVAGPLEKSAIILLILVLVENIGESSLLLPLGIPWFFALLSLLILTIRRFA